MADTRVDILLALRTQLQGNTEALAYLDKFEAAAKRSASSAGSSWDQMVGKLGRKLELPDLGKSILSGFGLGSGFAIAQKVADQFVDTFKEAASYAQQMAADTERSLNALEASLRLRRSDPQELDHMRETMARLQRQLDAKRNPTVTQQFNDGTRAGTVTLTSKRELTDADIAAATKLAADMQELDTQIRTLEKKLADARQKEAEKSAEAAQKENDQLDEALLKREIAAAQATEEEQRRAADRAKADIAAQKKLQQEEEAAAAIRAAQDAVEQYDTALAKLAANPYLTDQEKQKERLRLIDLQTEAIKAQKKALDDFAAAHPGVDVGGLTSARGQLGDKATAADVDRYKTQNRETLAQRDAKGLRDLSDPSRHYTSARGGAMGGIMSWLQQVGTLGDQVAANLANVFNSAASGIAQSIEGLINRTMTWGQALWNIGSSVLQGVIQAFSSMVAQWIVKQIVMAVAGKAIQAAQVAAMIPMAVAAAAIWSAPATLATIATAGAAAAAAPGEIAMAQMAVLMKSMTGFASGGIIPPGERLIRVNEAGTESVLNARATRNLGSDLIAALNSGEPLIPDLAQVLTRPGYAPGPAAAAGGGSPAGRSWPQSIALIDGRNRSAIEDLERDPRGEAFVVRIMDKHRGRFGRRT